MPHYLSVLGQNLLAALGLMFLVWLLSLKLRDAGIVDSFWGPGFVLIAWLTYLAADGFRGRGLLLAGLVSIWGLRLGGYIFLRNLGRGEDPRYRAMRERHGEGFGLKSLFIVFGLQALLMWIISLAVQLGQIAAEPDHFTRLDLAGAGLWCLGMIFEVGGDRQLARFKSEPANRGRVMNRGFWAYTRHPNYFGETLIWWGVHLIALSTPFGLPALVSPLVITYLLLKVSGVTLLEKNLVRTKPGYEEYVRNTSPFFPWFPKRSPREDQK